MPLPLITLAPLLLIAQVDATKCGADIDCPTNAICEAGVCTAPSVQPKQPKQPRPTPRVRHQPQSRDGLGTCRRHRHCPAGQQCFKRRCGPPIPSNGLGLRIGGWISTAVGIGAGGLAALYFIGASQTSRSEREVTTGLGIGFSVISIAAVATGIPLLVVGYKRRSAFMEWVRQHHPSVAVAPGKDSGALALGMRF